MYLLKINGGIYILHFIEEGHMTIIYDRESNSFFKASQEYVAQLNKEELENSIQAKVHKQVISSRPIRKKRLNKATFIVTNNCNLKCKYCFATYVNNKKQDIMFTETFKLAVDKLLVEYPEGINQIMLFGGEPLLAFDVIKEGIAYYYEKCQLLKCKLPQIGIVSNGTKLEQSMIGFLNQYNIDLTISLDGDKETNDLVRRDVNGNGVYDKVVENIKLYREQIKSKLYIEVTLNKNQLNAYKPGRARTWIQHFIEMGIDGIIVGVVESGDETLGFVAQDEEKYKLMYAEIVDFLIEGIIKGQVFLASDIINGIKVLLGNREVPLSCSAGVNNLTITSKGEIYPCYTLDKTEVFCMGHIEAPIGQEFYRVQNEFMAHYHNKPIECEACWLKKICGVWCRGLNYISKGQIRTVLEPRCWSEQVLYERLIVHLANLNKEDTRRFKQTLKEIAKKYRKEGEDYTGGN